MRLVMTADAVGGVWTYAVDLARGLQAHGVETVLALNGPAPAEPALAAARAAGIEVVLTGLPLDWLAEKAEEVEAAGQALADLAREKTADLVQLNSPAYGAEAPFDMPVVAVQHSCTSTWWKAVRGDAAWPMDFYWRHRLAQSGLRRAARTVAPTTAFAQAVRQAYHLRETPAVVWNGRAPIAPAARPLEVPPYLATSGRLWDEAKGMAVLDAAAARLTIPVVAAGALHGPTGGRAAFASLRTPGRLSERALAVLLAGAAAFVAPSLYEPFGLSVLEAAQAGRPLVLSDIPTFRELWDGAAVFTPPGDADALAEALSAVLDDEPRRARLGARARERSLVYTSEAMAQGMMRIYDSILGRDQLHS